MKALARLFTAALLIGIGASAATLLITLAAFLQWFKQFDVRPDFHTNGLLWYSTTALTFDAVVFPIFQITMLTLVAYTYIRRKDAFPDAYWFGPLMAAAVASLYFMFFWGWSRAPFAISVIPPVLVSAVSPWLYVAYLRARLRRLESATERHREDGTSDYL